MPVRSLTSLPYELRPPISREFRLTGEKLSLLKRIGTVAIKAINTLEKTVWKFIKEAAKICKSALKITVYVNDRLENKISKVITYLGLLSGIKLIFAAKGLYTDAEELKRCIVLKEGEGITLNLINVLSLPFDIASSILSFANTLHKLGAFSWLPLFSIVALPLSAGLLLYQTIRGLYDLGMLGFEFSQMFKEINNENFTDFRIYLDKKIGITDEERRKVEMEVGSKHECILRSSKDGKRSDIHIPLEIFDKSPSSDLNPDTVDQIIALEDKAEKEIKRRIKVIKSGKINRMKRHTDSKIVDIMLYIRKHLKNNPADMLNARKALSDIRKLSIRKIVLNSIESLFNLGELTMFGAELALPTVMTVPLLSFSLAKSCVSAAKTAYKSFAMHRGLELWDEVKEFKRLRKKSK